VSKKKNLARLIIDTKFIVVGFNEFILMRIGLIKVNFEVKNKCTSLWNNLEIF
jgi:hypothetical protein